MTSLLYVVLQHTQAKNIRIFYLKDAELNSGHVFLTYEYNGYVCFADQGGAHKYNNFKEGLTKRYAEYAKIVEVNPRYFLYPSLAPKEYFSKLEKNYIDLDIFNY